MLSKYDTCIIKLKKLVTVVFFYFNPNFCLSIFSVAQITLIIFLSDSVVFVIRIHKINKNKFSKKIKEVKILV